MLFDITFPEPRSEAQKTFAVETIIRQCILCCFDSIGSPLYSYEDLLGHDEALMRDTRALDASTAYQKACDEYEALIKRRRANLPTTAASLRILFEGDLSERYPDIATNGFDFGIVVSPSTESGLLLDGANATYAIFPRAQPGQWSDRVMWPFGYDAPHALITIPLQLDDSYFCGMIGSALKYYLAHHGLELIMDSNQQTVAGRRFEATMATLKEYPKMPLFIYDRSKHFFLCHALNALAEWASAKLGGGETSIVSVGAETNVTFGDNESVTATPAPFLQRA